MIRRIKGVIPVVITPLKENGDIDAESCASLIECLVDAGVAGLFALGSASEGFMLDNEQRTEAVRAMAEANRGRTPLIVGCANMAPRNVFRFFKSVEKMDISGFHFIPEDLKLGEQRLITLVEAYADKAPFPLFLYHNIKRGRAITFKIAESLKKHPNVKGMKVGGYDRDEMKAFLTLDHHEFQVFGSGGGQFYMWLELGAKAVTASSACCFPREFKELYDNFMSGRMKEAYDLQQWWNNFHKCIPNTASENGEYAAEEKYILKSLGVIKNDYCHFPYRGLTVEEKRKIDKALSNYC